MSAAERLAPSPFNKSHFMDCRYREWLARLEVKEQPSQHRFADAPLRRDSGMNFLHGEIVARDGALHFTEPSGTALTLPKCREAAYAGSIGKPVVLGVRPDHILRPGAAAGCAVRVVVRDVEPLGPHTLVIGRVGEFPFTAQMQVGVAAEPDRPFEVALDLERAHLFDKSTGRVIMIWSRGIWDLDEWRQRNCKNAVVGDRVLRGVDIPMLTWGKG